MASGQADRDAGGVSPLMLTAGDRILARLDDLVDLLSAHAPGAAPGPGSRLSDQIAMQGQIIDALMAERDRADRDLAALSARVAALESQDDGALGACADRLGELLLRLEAQTIDRLGDGPPLRATLCTLADLVTRLEARLAAEQAPPPSQMMEPEPARAEDFRLALAEVLAPDVTAA